MDRNLIENNYKKANNQLFHIDSRKYRIKKEIYTLYDSYLSIIRYNLQNYVGEAIKSLLDISNNGISSKDQNTILFIKNELKNLVNNKLPFLTIEQLSIRKEYKIDNQIKNNRDLETNYDLKVEVYATENSETIYANNSLNYINLYYKNIIIEDNFRNINIDNPILENKYFDDNKKDDSLGLMNSTILLNDFDEDKLSINIHQCKDSKYFIPIEFKDILLWIDTLESSLNLYLQDLSIEINNQLFKKNIFKRFINYDLLLYVFDNHLLFSNPSPFVLKFDPSLTKYINFDEDFCENKILKTNLISINSAELEFININLSMLKNKLFELKSNINILIKKENYWCKKLKHNHNIKPTINKL